MSRKSKLGTTATKASLKSLRDRGLIRWSAKSKHPNEYILPFSGADATDTHDKDNEGSPAPNDSTIVEGAVCTLAQSFATLLADSKRRFSAPHSTTQSP